MAIDDKLLEHSADGDLKRLGFVAGFGTACVELATTHGEGALAYYLLDNAGMTLDTYRASGMDADDCAVIEGLFQNKG